MEITYSLIIPHYNIPHLLRRLLRTVPRRNDLQVIVVDDCSTKNLDELSEVKKEFDWVEWYDTGTNGGGGKARNVGLEHATGKYVLFADSDDFFLPSIHEILDEYKYKNEYDLIIFNSISLTNDNLSLSDRSSHILKMFSDYKKNYDKGMLELKYLFGEPWSKLINRTLIVNNNIKFDEVPIHNDTKFSYLVSAASEKTYIREYIYYCNIERNNSVSSHIDWDKLELRLKIFIRKNKFLRNKGIRIFDFYEVTPFIVAIKEKNYNYFRRYLKLYKTNGRSYLYLLYRLFQYMIKRLNKSI